MGTVSEALKKLKNNSIDLIVASPDQRLILHLVDIPSLLTERL